MKKARVKIIKNNIEVGTKVPMATNDAIIGQFFDEQMMIKGHFVDRFGSVDMPEYGSDNKARNLYSKANHTIGSNTIQKIIDTGVWEDTSFYRKSLNPNQITYDPNFNEVVDVKLVDMDINLIQKNLKEGYLDCREQLIAGCRTKEIKSKNGWVVLDGYNHPNSYRMRITNKAMKKIHNISGNRDTFKQHFEETV
jgi:hypothetical protein